MWQPDNSPLHESLPEPDRAALVIGASGGIGNALFHGWQQQEDIDRVIGISRLVLPSESDEDKSHVWIQTDYSDESIGQICSALAEENLNITRVCICNGILHNENVWPDKRIEDLEMDALQEIFRINSFLPMMWLKHLMPLLKSDEDCIVTVFSARIGSITDNRLGGWYSYRASKAALNMMLKTASIEFARRAKNVKLIAFHPGTTDTPLSRPFQKNIAHEILKPTVVADSLIDIMKQQHVDGSLSYLDWEGEPIDW